MIAIWLYFPGGESRSHRVQHTTFIATQSKFKLSHLVEYPRLLPLHLHSFKIPAAQNQTYPGLGYRLCTLYHATATFDYTTTPAIFNLYITVFIFSSDNVMWLYSNVVSQTQNIAALQPLAMLTYVANHCSTTPVIASKACMSTRTHHQSDLATETRASAHTGFDTTGQFAHYTQPNTGNEKGLGLRDEEHLPSALLLLIRP
jgi:hypothetical protein